MKIVGHRSLSCNRHHGSRPHCEPLLQRSQLRCPLFPWASRAATKTASTVPLWMVAEAPSPAQPAVLSAPFHVLRCGRVALTRQRRSFRSGVTAALRPIAVSPAPTFVGC